LTKVKLITKDKVLERDILQHRTRFTSLPGNHWIQGRNLSRIRGKKNLPSRGGAKRRRRV